MNISKKEVIAIIEYLETEKGLSRNIASDIIRDSLVSAIEKSRNVSNLEVHIDQNSGVFVISSVREIVEKAEERGMQISLEDVRKIVPTAKIGEYVRAPIDNSLLCRNVAHKTWQILKQKIEDKFLEALYKEYRSNSGNIVRGVIVKKMINGSLLIDIGRMTAILRRNHYSSKEFYKEGDRISVVFVEEESVETVDGETGAVSPSKTKIVLSRMCDKFIYGLLSNEIPEINRDIIRIVAIERIPGVRCKIVAFSEDPNVDVIGSCVGNRGSRIARISEELQNEKMEIIPYSENQNEMIRNIFNKINIIYILKSNNSVETIIDIVTDDDSFPSAVGRFGINVKLASKALGYKVKLHRVTAFNLMLEEMKDKVIENEQVAQSLIEKEKIGSFLWNNLNSKGFKTYADLLKEKASNILSIEGMSIEIFYKMLMSLKDENKEFAMEHRQR